MFQIGILLAISAFLPSPVSSVASGAAVAPEEDCAAFAVRAIDDAEREILVGAYGLTTGSGIVEAAGAAQNSENLNLASSPTVAAAYAAHWRERLAASVRR